MLYKNRTAELNNKKEEKKRIEYAIKGCYTRTEQLY